MPIVLRVRPELRDHHAAIDEANRLASGKGLKTPFSVSDEALMVVELAPGAIEDVSGMVVYPPPFEDV